MGGGTKATTPTPAPPTPMHSMMNEMARTLARRRAQVDRNEVNIFLFVFALMLSGYIKSLYCRRSVQNL